MTLDSRPPRRPHGDYRIRWRTEIAGIGTDPTSDKGHFDLRAAYWPANDTIALAGASRTLLISSVDGAVKFQDKPQFTGLGGLDYLEIVVSTSGAFLVFVSTKRMVVVAGDLTKKCGFDLAGLAKTAEPRGQDALRLVEYDFDPTDLETILRETILDLQSCVRDDIGSPVTSPPRPNRR